MRGRLAWLGPSIALAALVACGDAGIDPPRIDGATPAWGPLVGGTRVTITGSGFASATPVRVLVAGRAAPLAATVDDATLEVVVPPGTQPGDAELVVLGEHGSARATGVFRYSTAPTITAVEPADVLYDAGTTSITVSGSGFVDEDAGGLTVVLDGQWITGVEVLTDTTLRFVAPPGRPLAQPALELVDQRGRVVRPRAFRYVPSTHPGLLLFPAFGPFAVYFDPAAGTTVTVPAVLGAARFTAVVRDRNGDYWGADRGRRFGRIDLSAQTLETPIPTQAWVPTMIEVDGAHFAIDRGGLRFGRFDPATGAFTTIGEQPVPCCGSYGLAAADGAAYLVARDAGVVSIAPIDLATGAIGAAVPLTGTPGIHVEEMRFFAGTLYAANRNGALVTVDPLTGATTVVPQVAGRFRAMELFE